MKHRVDLLTVLSLAVVTKLCSGAIKRINPENMLNLYEVIAQLAAFGTDVITLYRR